MAQTQQQTPKQNDLKPPQNGKPPDDKKATDAAKAQERSGNGEMDQLFEKHRKKIEEVAQAHVNPDRLFRVAMLVRSRSELLGKCTADSFFRCLGDCAELGLEPSGQVGGVHLVPRFNKKLGKYEATIVVDYRAMVELAIRSERISNVEAGAVYEGDGFRFRRGLRPVLDHEPVLTGKRGNILGVWSVVTYRDGSKTFEVMRWDEVLAIRDRGGDVWKSGPWATDEVPMGLKTVVKKSLKLAPKSKELAKALATDDEGEIVEGSVVHHQQHRALPSATGIEIDLGQSRTESVTEKVRTKMATTDQQAGETVEEAAARARAEAQPKDAPAPKAEQKPLPISDPNAEPPADVKLPGQKDAPKDPWEE